jgi:hypothetical protein
MRTLLPVPHFAVPSSDMILPLAESLEQKKSAECSGLAMPNRWRISAVRRLSPSLGATKRSSSRRRNALLSRGLTRLPLPFGPMSRSLAMLVRSLAVSPKADLARLAGLSLANPEELSVVPNHL